MGEILEGGIDMNDKTYKECPHYKEAKEKKKKECNGLGIYGQECEGCPYCKF